MNIIKSIFIGFASLFLASCNSSSQNQKMVTKAKDTPEVNKMIDSFNSQKHRIEFNGCEMFYNGKPFQLGMTIDELVDVFGEYELTDLGAIVYEDSGIVFATNEREINPSSKIDIIYIYIYMNTKVSDDYKEKLIHELNHKKDFFLIQGMPVDKNMRVIDFIANSKFELDDFAISNYGYELEYACNDKKIRYDMEADGLWLRKGAGHLTFKDRPNDKNENTFQLLSITEVNEE